MRSGMKIWVDEDQVAPLEKALDKLSEHVFIRIKGRVINTADMQGLFLPPDVEKPSHVKIS